MSKTVNIALAGIGGYGGHYLRALFEAPEERDVRLVGAIDPVAAEKHSESVQELEERGIPIYPDIEAFFAEKTADLVVVSSPHHFHCPQTCQALAQGANVLCEKPAAATIQEVRQMMDAGRRAGKFVAIGFQWSYTTAVQELKRDIMAGHFGKPIRLKTLVLAPRTETYYRRNHWAGSQRAPDGSWVLDSPVNNATAHYLHNMLYLLGADRESSAAPADVAAELYRANAIDNFDTAALRCHTDAGSEILFYSTHAVSVRIGPVLCYQFDKATVYFDRYGSAAAPQFMARFQDGTVRAYGTPAGEDHRKLWDCVDAVRTGAPVACGAKAASAHTRCVNGAQDSMPEIVGFPRSLIDAKGEPGARQLAVRGLEDAFIQCYDQGILPSEHGDLGWSRRGRTVGLSAYERFPSREGQGRRGAR